ncbi:MAG: TIGR03435 family protein [Vicinamibacterales bacterium]
MTAASVKFLVPFAWLVSLGAQFKWRRTPTIPRPGLEICGASVASPLACVAGTSGWDPRRRIELIRPGDSGRPRTAAKRLALVCVYGAVLCAPIAAGALSAASQGRAQGPPANLQFEVASIKANVSAEPRPPGLSFVVAPNGQLTAQNITLFHIVRNAYDVQGVQIVPGANAPDWLERDRWDIVANAPERMASRLQTMAMMQNLLATRFKLVLRRETREMPVYALVPARSDRRLGPRLRQSDGQCEAARVIAEKGGAPLKTPEVERGFCGSRSVAGLAAMSGVALADFARYLAPQTGRFVIDRTGLTGTFDLDLTWTPDPTTAAGGPPSAFNDGTTLFAAIQEQLGLKLEAQRAPIDVLVIQSAERPPAD